MACIFPAMKAWKNAAICLVALAMCAGCEEKNGPKGGGSGAKTHNPTPTPTPTPTPATTTGGGASTGEAPAPTPAPTPSPAGGGGAAGAELPDHELGPVMGRGPLVTITEAHLAAYTKDLP
ncbi:MAG: hypothetical protein ACI9WU_005036, partial [Myxococcota bacterium]